jgi:hypothetical protein
MVFILQLTEQIRLALVVAVTTVVLMVLEAAQTILVVGATVLVRVLQDLLDIRAL